MRPGILPAALCALALATPSLAWRFELRNDPADGSVELWFDPEGAAVALAAYSFDFTLDPAVVAFAGSYSQTPPGSLVPDLLGPAVAGPGGIENLNAGDLARASLVSEPIALASLDLVMAGPVPADGVPDVGFAMERGAIVNEALFSGGEVTAVRAAPLDFPIRACNDGRDNDGDGAIDWNGGTEGLSPDPNCSGPGDAREKAGCGLGFEAALALLALDGVRRRRHG